MNNFKHETKEQKDYRDMLYLLTTINALEIDGTKKTEILKFLKEQFNKISKEYNK